MQASLSGTSGPSLVVEPAYPPPDPPVEPLVVVVVVLHGWHWLLLLQHSPSKHTPLRHAQLRFPWTQQPQGPGHCAPGGILWTQQPHGEGQGAPGGTLCPISPAVLHPESLSIPPVDDDASGGELLVVELVALSPHMAGASATIAIAMFRDSDQRDRATKCIGES